MQLKKLLQGSTFALVAAACAIAVPSVAKAATTEEPEKITGTFAQAGLTGVEVDEDQAILYADGEEGTTEVLVGFGKLNKKGELTIASWDTYDGSSATVDLSKLSNVKENYIAISTPGKPVSVVKIPASAKKIKAKYDASKGLQVGSGDTATAADLTLSTVTTSGKDKLVTPGTASLYEFKTTYGSWQEIEYEGEDGYEFTDLSLYQEEGAKLTVRVKSTSEANVDDKGVWGQDDKTSVKYGTQDANVYVAGALPGKEAKVTIPAKAKGPKATADYVNGTVKFPKNSEYRVATTARIYPSKNVGTDKNPEYVTDTPLASPTDKITIEAIYKAAGIELVDDKGNPVEDAPQVADIEVRTKAGTKAASKWGRLTIELPKTLIATTYTNKGDVDVLGDYTVGALTDEKDIPVASDINEGESKFYGEKGIALSELNEDGKNILKVEYTEAAKKPALKITNNGKKTYEFVVKAKGSTEVASTDKATKAAPGKTITLKNVEDEQVVFVRIAGDKKAKTWLSAYANLGQVDLKKEVKGTKKAE